MRFRYKQLDWTLKQLISELLTDAHIRIIKLISGGKTLIINAYVKDGSFLIGPKGCYIAYNKFESTSPKEGPMLQWQGYWSKK